MINQGGDEMDLSKLLGPRYQSIEEANCNVDSNQMVVTDNDQTYHIIQQEVFWQGLFQLNFKIVLP